MIKYVSTVDDTSNFHYVEKCYLYTFLKQTKKLNSLSSFVWNSMK